MTTEHLPECPRIEYIVNRHGYTLTAGSNVCMCNALRACEQRVLDAAREAIKKQALYLDPECEYRALAAIDALRDDPPSLPPTKGRAHKY